jgi:RecB family exonuclease
MAELEITPGRHGKLGDGVHVSTLAGAVGLDVDVVVVLGAAEGLLPPAPVVDPLIGDRERAAAGLAPSDQLAALVHRQFLAATTTTPHALVTVPRGDLRATAVRPRTRWLDPLLPTGAERVVDSHAQGLASTTFPVSEGEHRLRELWVCARAGHDVRHLPVASTDAVLRRALALRDARASDDFTIYDGNLIGRGAPALPALVSPTQLEAWTACPHAYFVRHVLGVRPIEEPADVEQLGAADRGIALHAALDRLHGAVIAGELPQPGPAGWSPAHLAHLQQACAEVAHELEQRGRTGWAAFWANDRAALHAVLDAWVAHENDGWPGSRIVQSERRFDVDDAVALTLPSGRSVAFKGSIDRVEELPDGRLVVTDHKSGKARGLEKLSVDDPTLGASRFQLPVYAVAARATLGRPDAEVEARYSFFREDFRTVAIRFDADVWARVGDAVELVVAGIEAGVFPARPDRPAFRPWVSCHYCEPDELGTAVRWGEWERKRRAPALARWFPDPDDADDEGGGGDA